MSIEENLIKLNIFLFYFSNNELLGKYNEIWESVIINIKKGFDSEHLFNERYLKAKTKS